MEQGDENAEEEEKEEAEKGSN
jgi:hypothetical protein